MKDKELLTIWFILISILMLWMFWWVMDSIGDKVKENYDRGEETKIMEIIE